MFGNDNRPCKRPVQVFLDGKQVLLPEEVQKSLSAVRSQLELMALRQDRVLATMLVDGLAMELRRDACHKGDFHHIHAHTISFKEMGRQMAITAIRDILVLRAHVEKAITLVLINEWDWADRLLHHIKANFRIVLLVVSVLREICESSHCQLPTPMPPLDELLVRAKRIDIRIELLEDQQDLVAFSDFLEQEFEPWLHDIGIGLDYLAKGIK